MIHRYIIGECVVCNENMVIIFGSKFQKIPHTGRDRGNVGLVLTLILMVLANISTHRCISICSCSLHCRDGSDWSFSGSQSCSHMDCSDNAGIVTLLFGQEECW